MSWNHASCLQNSPGTNLDDFRGELRKLGLVPTRSTFSRNQSNFFYHSACLAEWYNGWWDKIGIYIKWHWLLKNWYGPLLFDSVYEVNEITPRNKNKKWKIRYILGSDSGSFKWYTVNDDNSLKLITDWEWNSTFKTFNELYVETAIHIDELKWKTNAPSIFALQKNPPIENLTTDIPAKIGKIVTIPIPEEPKDPKKSILDSIKLISPKLEKNDWKVVLDISEVIARKLKWSIKKMLNEEWLTPDNDLIKAVMLEIIKNFITKN